MIYVCSDIHGYFETFMTMLEKIKFSDSDTMYILGDVVDRGLHPIKTLHFISQQKNMKLILGNHEDMMWESIANPTGYMRYTWLSNGGIITENQFYQLSDTQQIILMHYLINCPLYEIVGQYVLCHAGIEVSYEDLNLSVSDIMERQSRETLLWAREEFFCSPTNLPCTVIFGHTPTSNMYPYKPMHTNQMSIWHDKLFNDKIGIDCGVPFSGGRLGCLRLDDLQEFYV